MELRVNETVRAVQEGDTGRTLLSVLRDELNLTGTKYGCGEGQCGACTVLLDGLPTRSCLTTLQAAAGKKITTIEGLERNGKLHPLQQAFMDADAMQCGYCTSGMIMSGAGLLAKNPDPAAPDILHAMQGNICRCGTYSKIVNAVRLAARSMKGASHAV
jgi:aerobic-type carbon monoxide dehydrogenase small subunit (CoxS/CutS family)